MKNTVTQFVFEGCASLPFFVWCVNAVCFILDVICLFSFVLLLCQQVSFMMDVRKKKEGKSHYKKKNAATPPSIKMLLIA